MPRDHLHFVTGRLAEHALRAIVGPLSAEHGFAHSIDVLPITVAALMTPAWIAKRWNPPPTATRIIIPGYCAGDLGELSSQAPAAVERGPHDLRQLPAYLFGRQPASDYGAYNIQIIAEINHCPRLSLAEILSEAGDLVAAGADLIDVGCDPGDAWPGVGDAVRALRNAGHRVSIDSLNAREIEPAVAAGAELVLSVNSSNRDAAADWGVEVVAIPDDPTTLAGLDGTIDQLAAADVRLRIDPTLEPIGCGFAASLGRYLETRRRYPDAELLMGVGNLTELTDVDSAGVNAVLLGFCEELGVRSVLTTQVIDWARTSVAECDVARRLMHHAVASGTPPKHLDNRLVMLRDARLNDVSVADVVRLAEQLKDPNYRLFAAGGEIHLVAAGLHLHGDDPFVIMDQLRHAGPDGESPKNLDAAHAFYLGYEMCKASVAINLGKNYEQDESLNWGLATQPETRHYLK